MQSAPTLSSPNLASERASSYFEQVRAQFLEMVRNMGVGDRVPPERELAQTLGASTLMVGRVLQELQREGLVQRIPGKGTFLTGEALFSTANETRSSPIKVAAATVIFARLVVEPNQILQQKNWGSVAVSRLERAIQQAGGKTLVVNCQTTADDEIAGVMKQLSKFGANSAIFIGAVEQDEAWLAPLQQWQEEATPTLVHLSFGKSVHSGDTVSFDGVWGNYIAGQHLRELGHTSIAYIAPEVPANAFDFAIERFAGLQRAFLTVPNANLEMVRLPLARVGNSKHGEFWQKAGEVAAQKWEAEERSHFSAVMLANDLMAQGFMESRRASKHTTPLSIVGYDDTLISSALGLTTIHVPIEAMAEQAAQLLERRLQQPFNEGWGNIVLKPQLVVRSSTRANGSDEPI